MQIGNLYSDNMVITRTPLRISFFGGGTDYPKYYEEHGGEVLSTSIDRYVYLTVSRLDPLFQHRIRVAYAKTELVREISEIQHPSVRACLQHLGMKGGVEISVSADLPARTGLGSSSSFTVGLLHALHAYQGKLVSPAELAREAIFVEQKVIGEGVGSQDQVAAALGGFRHIVFAKEPLFVADPLPLSTARKEELQKHLLLFFTGQTRLAEEVLQEQSMKTNENRELLSRMRELVEPGRKILVNEAEPLKKFGALLDEAWNIKRSLSAKISNSLVDQAYEAGRRAGAEGGKLLGAGGGGFLLFFVQPKFQAKVREALRPLVEVPFRFESGGSRLIYIRHPSESS